MGEKYVSEKYMGEKYMGEKYPERPLMGDDKNTGIYSVL